MQMKGILFYFFNLFFFARWQKGKLSRDQSTIKRFVIWHEEKGGGLPRIRTDVKDFKISIINIYLIVNHSTGSSAVFNQSDNRRRLFRRILIDNCDVEMQRSYAKCVKIGRSGLSQNLYIHEALNNSQQNANTDKLRIVQ